MSALLQLLVNGLVFSCIIVLGGIGLSLVYSIADFANFAHGDLMTVGAFAAFVSAGALAGVLPDVTFFELPLALYVGLFVGMAAAALVAVGTEWLVYRPLKNAGSIELLITSIGVALAYRALIQMQFGSGQRSYAIDRQGRVEWLFDAVGVALTPRDFVVIGLTLALVVGLHALLQYTTLGRKMRATADNPNLARVSGIRTREVVLAMWIIGGALAAAGGVFLGIDLLVRPRMGFDLLLVVFAAVILGGIGSVYGAMLGGLVIGMAHELTPAIPFVGVEYASGVAFVLMVAILLLRPHGIMGEPA
ncbi:branched-chain amino acid ABC transporter permease [Haloprofundus marisrubri]|uniref:Branched-chain amino acid ABC transporter permease n=1 Tax=Haloprofundus marisrubri TaxID=1514971 RepID=A0A0W1R9R0_9EURY|nr:branched-chain amino acid ABC transporter permease [Haloprofundus marisrubri]KTG10189.1 branched-chain amino acid ABC transporter permease [Haloprofundus marisrubri]